VALAHTDQGGQLNLYICSFSYFIQIGAGNTNFNRALAAKAGVYEWPSRSLQL